MEDGASSPGVLHLRRWSSSRSQFQLSEFSQAFISPTRTKLLLLHSRNSEALLTPLLITDSESEEIESNTISDVKFVSWGHCGDAYSEVDDNGFREVLITYGDSGFVAHAFRDLEEGEEEGDAKKLLEQFVAEAETSVSGSSYITRFPGSLLIPDSAGFISFGLNNSILKVLEFFSSRDHVVDRKDMESLGDASSSIEDFHFSTPYECLKMFSSSSCHYVGLVLGFSGSSSNKSSKNFDKFSGRVIVVVILLHKWGLEWVSPVDLQSLCAGPGPGHCWADFEFLENYLVCLSASGLIWVLDAKSGVRVCSIDVLRNCRQDKGASIKFDNKQGHVDEVSASRMTVENLDGPPTNNVSEICAKEKAYRGTFRKLIVSTHSLLLGCIDDNGTVYFVCVDSHIVQNHYTVNRLTCTPEYFYSGILASWKIAGSEISGCGLSDFSNEQDVNTMRIRSGHSSSFNGTKGSVQIGYPNGLAIGLQDKSCRHHCSRTGMASIISRMRKVILPPKKWDTRSPICLSPFGLTRLIRDIDLDEKKSYRIIHALLNITSSKHDLGDPFACLPSLQECSFTGPSIGCSFQGCLYLVTQYGLSVVLPAVDVSSSLLHKDCISYWQPSSAQDSHYEVKYLVEISEPKGQFTPWQIEILDKALLYEGADEAERICLENGWDLKFARIRRLQLALQYMRFDEIEKSLDMLANSDLVEDGILRLLFASVYQIFCINASESEVALASRLLALAACFATKMARRYGLAEHKRQSSLSNARNCNVSPHLEEDLPKKKLVETSFSRKLYELALFLEVIRNIQNRMITKGRKPSEEVGLDVKDVQEMVDADSIQGVSSLPVVAVNTECHDAEESVFSVSDLVPNSHSRQTSPLMNYSNDELSLRDATVNQIDSFQRRPLLHQEKSKDMIARWEMDNLDLRTVVKDALRAGRLPLAVLQLHMQHQKDSQKGSFDTFSEVREIGKAIVYDLFLKGEGVLAIEILRRLGEDVEVVLRQLLLGTVRRSLRAQIAYQMKNHDYLRPHEWRILERIYLLERLYPSSSFWGSFLGRKKGDDVAVAGFSLKMILHGADDLTVECGDVDGVVIGLWTSLDSSSTVCEDTGDGGYWASAAVWSDSWDPRTIERIVLDQPFHIGVHVSWESQFEYHLVHYQLEEVYKLLDVIPTTSLSEGTLKIDWDYSDTTANSKKAVQFTDPPLYISAMEDLEVVCMNIPNVTILRSSATSLCPLWLKIHVEKELAKKSIFLQEFWGSTAEIMPLLARAGLVINISKLATDNVHSRGTDFSLPNRSEPLYEDTAEAFHKLVVRYCTKFNLPSLLDIYLDHHNLVLDDDSLAVLLESTDDCNWAKWLLCSRVKGHEYEASFCNARSNLFRQRILGSNLSIVEPQEILFTIDDVAEGSGEMAALATLMYAAEPMQKCICRGSINRNRGSSSQCTLENLKLGLQHFPTLWRTLVSACLGQDVSGCLVSSSVNYVYGKSSFSDYLNWRSSMFSSSGADSSLVQMLPFWFSKYMKRLIELFVQGPLGWQTSSSTLSGRAANYTIDTKKFAGFNSVAWEANIQRSIEEELYSSLKENGSGIEYHLHRGRPLVAFKYLVGTRVQKLKDSSPNQQPSGQRNYQSDIQKLFTPLSQDEKSLLSSVIPQAIMHYEDPVLVATCAFLLELCGVSAGVLRVDVAALRRIASYYASVEKNTPYELVSPKGTSLHATSPEVNLTASLARTLADDYIHHDNLNSLDHKDFPSSVATGEQPLVSLTTVLQHLEKASLPSVEESKSCGSWLSSGIGDGFVYRSQQKNASKHWHLVTTFCRMHLLPLSTKYLSLLANGNDWVGFLTEAQLGGFPVDVVAEVATREFTDPRLRAHILTVLSSMQTTKTKNNFQSNTSEQKDDVSYVGGCKTDAPAELFGLLAECENQNNSGSALLKKAKDLRWPLLAIIASCFTDVSSLCCLTVWLEITASRETSIIKVNHIYARIASSVGAAVEATNTLSPGRRRALVFRYNRKNPKRQRLMDTSSENSSIGTSFSSVNGGNPLESIDHEINSAGEGLKMTTGKHKASKDPEEELALLSNMVAALCEKHLFLPLLRAFEMFLPSCSLLPFIRSLQAFSQMRLSEASAHLASFSARIKDEQHHSHISTQKDGHLKTAWTSSTAIKAAEAMLSSCPSAYEKRCLLHLAAAADFGDGGSASTYFRRLYWKIDLAEPSLRDDNLCLGNEALDDASLLTALVKHGHWEQAHNWARQLESSSTSWKSSVHHVTEKQAEAMVVEWKEFLWDIPEERPALWNHCQTLFLRHSFPALQAGLFFLKHAETAEKEISTRELHEILLLALQWLSGTITQSDPVYPLHLLREIETRVWLLAVESEAQYKAGGDFGSSTSIQNVIGGISSSIIEQTAIVVTKMDHHINTVRVRAAERNSTTEHSLTPYRNLQSDSSTPLNSSRTKRRAKLHTSVRKSVLDSAPDNTFDSDDHPNSTYSITSTTESSKSPLSQDENVNIEASVSAWEDNLKLADLERAILSLLEFGQIVAAKQLQQKLSPTDVPSELVVIDSALKLAALSSSSPGGEVNDSALEPKVLSVIRSYDIPVRNHVVDALQALEILASKCAEGRGRGLCRRIIAVEKSARVLGLEFSEAFEKRPIELLQLLSLKAQDSLNEAKLLVETHSMSSSSVARILAESFLKGLLAAHRGGYMDSQKEEGPAPLLWRFSDFFKWAELCPSESEIGHALMRVVMTGQDIPHACEVELLILSHHFYKSSACLDGVDVLVTLAANRVESYVIEGDFSCLARLVTGVSNFHALNFILNILIENGQLELLLQKYSTAEAATGTADTVRGFRMAVLTSLMLFNPNDFDALAMVYNHFDMKHETASILESRSVQSIKQWQQRRDRDRQNEDLLDAMRHYIEAAEVHSTIDAGQKTHRACARASLLSLQIRIPDFQWLDLSETNARRALVDQSRFQEALIVAEAYNLNQPSEWALALWNQMLKPDVIEQYVAEFVMVLPLQPSMLLELARFYRAEVAARGDQSHFSVWLSPGGLPAEWMKHLGRSFRSLLRRTQDLRVKVQVATIATGFPDVIDTCMKLLDKVPDTAGPLILRKGHGGAYLPLM